MTAHEAWPDIKVFALRKLDQTNVNRCGISHEYLRKHFGLSKAAIRDVLDICIAGDDELNGEDYMGDLCFWRRS